MKREAMREDVGAEEAAPTTTSLGDGLQGAASDSGFTARGEPGRELAQLQKITLRRLWPDIDPEQFCELCLSSAALTVEERRRLLASYLQLSHHQAKHLLQIWLEEEERMRKLEERCVRQLAEVRTTRSHRFPKGDGS